MMEVVVTAGPVRHTKTQSDRHHSKPTPSVFTDWMPFCCPPRSIRALKGKAYLLFLWTQWLKYTLSTESKPIDLLM